MSDIVISDQRNMLVNIDRPQAFWTDWGLPGQLVNIDISGTLSGTVEVSSVLQANSIVTLYYRPNGKFIARVLTNSSGIWSVPNLDKSVDDYYAVAQTETNNNALIFDKLTPV